MSTTLTTERRHESQREQELELHQHQPLRRLTPADRLALHLGVALIRWSRRPSAHLARHERRATRLEQALLHREQLRIDHDVERARDRARTAQDLRQLTLR
jgi:hypothetical protein